MPSDLKARLEALRVQGALSLPTPGGGETRARHRRLMELGHTDLSLARLAEAHTDALAILSEAGVPPRSGARYGVWASDGPKSQLAGELQASGRWRLEGIKQYCSGARLLTAALVTAHRGDELLVFDVPLDAEGITVGESTWVNAGLADTDTSPVRFQNVEVEAERRLGGPQWYLSRPGFWHGALGPAACWAGGALSLIDAAAALDRKDPHSRAQLGALLAIGWALRALLAQAADEVDADPSDKNAGARTRALSVRHLIERYCTEVLDRFGRASGPQLLAFDDHIARQYAALTLYIRQCHAERDLATIPAS